MSKEQLLRRKLRGCDYHPWYSGNYDPASVNPGCGGCKTIRSVTLEIRAIDEREAAGN